MYWGNGRQLTDVETDDGQTRSQISYGYDADGIRSWKAVDGEIHTYLTQGGKVMRETVGSTVMDFAYDESGRPFAMTYQSANEDPQTYYYVLNIQGDVVKLVTASGTEAASYAYDAWGNLLSATGSMAYTNPLRYRGYYYDAETRFYYLQSRYYDPVYHRFINADVYASTGQGFAGTNMFAYCKNNPARYSDSSGMKFVDYNVIYHQNGRAEYADTGTGHPLWRCVSDEINSALWEEIQNVRIGKCEMLANQNQALLLDFYLKVNTNAPWDIKRKESWQDTIGTPYPGYNQPVLYCGHIMTPEQLGNFTYGCLGRAYGFDLDLLHDGSFVAAHFPEEGTNDWINEMEDWSYIDMGYNEGMTYVISYVNEARKK